MQRLHRHLRARVAAGAGGGLGGEERGGLLRGLARQARTAPGSARRRGRPRRGARAPRPRPTARRGCGPGGGSEAAATSSASSCAWGSATSSASSRSAANGCASLRVPGLEVRLAGLRELALGDQRLGVREGAGALERQQQLLVRRGGRRQAAGGEAQAQALAGDLGGGQARLSSAGTLKPRLTAASWHSCGQHAGGEAGGAAQLHLRQQPQRGHGRARAAPAPAPTGVAREAIQAHVVEVDGQPVAVPVEGDLEGDGGALRRLQPGLALQVAGAEVQLQLLQLAQSCPASSATLRVTSSASTASSRKPKRSFLRW